VNVDAPPSSDLTVSGRTETPPRRGSRWWGLIGVAPIVPLVVERIQILTRRHPTGADETLYLMMALNWLGRITKQSTDAHRTRGLPALLYPAARFTDATWVYRLGMVLLSLSLYVLVYLIGRSFMSRVAAASAALLLCLFNTTLLSSVALLPDLPAAVAI